MSLSKPVVLGCGFPSVIKAPESKGLLAETVALHAECDKADELAKHIISLLDQPDWAMQLGQRAKQYVSHQFRWAKTSKETLAVYKECENA
jgi:glycosyltransferase involved in cell wall biosynthesis